MNYNNSNNTGYYNAEIYQDIISHLCNMIQSENLTRSASLLLDNLISV